jgi:hypothetical protein
MNDLVSMIQGWNRFCASIAGQIYFDPHLENKLPLAFHSWNICFAEELHLTETILLIVCSFHTLNIHKGTIQPGRLMAPFSRELLSPVHLFCCIPPELALLCSTSSHPKILQLAVPWYRRKLVECFSRPAFLFSIKRGESHGVFSM